MNTQQFDGRTVLVVGGSSGIGAAVAQAFAANGAQVTIASRNGVKLEAIARQIGTNVTPATLDFTDDANVEAFFANGVEYDHVVVTAGETPTGPARVLSLADAYAAMNSKFWVLTASRAPPRFARVARLR